MPVARYLVFLGLCLLVGMASLIDADPVRAQSNEAPYWASTRFDEVNMRVGPSVEYKIDWVYKRKGLPLKVVRLREGWRLVQDPDGDQGWVAESQLILKRTAIIVGEGLVDMRETANASSALRWRVEPGVIGDLGNCDAGWCELDVSGRKGWVEEARLWGAGKP